MSTRGCIARRGPAGEFSGRYHHWDAYPSGLGRTLFALYNGYFKRDLRAMLKYLLDDHPAGWSTIEDADFSQPPGFNEGGFETTGPHCYCHGGRHEDAHLVTQDDASEIGVEYVYVFDEPRREMAVLSSRFSRSGKKMIGMFGYGADAKEIYWHVIAVVKLDQHEPDWERISKGE